jgi:competence protein ComEC
MNARLFYTAIFSFVTAVALGTVIVVAAPYYFFLLLLGGALGVVAFLYRALSSHLLVTTCAIALVAAGGGLWRAHSSVTQYAMSSLWSEVGQKVVLTGQIVREPDVRERTTQLYVRVDGASDIILVSVDRYTDVAYGDTVTATGKLTVPEEFTTDLGRTFLYPEYLKAKGVQFQISFATVEVLERGGGNPIIAGLLTFKEAFVGKLGLVLSEPQSGLGVGLLLGVKRALGEELEEAFRKTGIIHIVVLSGYNVMLVVAFVLFILGTFLPFTARAVCGIIAIVLFALLVGLSPTVVRASIMASLVLLAPLLGRRYHLLRALMVAGCVMIFINPYILLYDVGFQLSFLATLGLILVAPQFELLFMRAPNTLKVREFFIATLATQVAVAPLLLYQIGELSLIALIVNVLVLPMVGVAMLLTFITGMVAFVSLPLANISAIPTHFSLLYIIECARFFAGVPYAVVSAPPFPVWLMAVAYGVMGVSWYMVTQKGKLVARSGDALLAHQVLPRGIDTWTVVSEETVREQRAEKDSSRVVGALAPTIKPVSPKDEEPIFFR